ncbi:MAG: leucine-rich repeat domain-containing protein, partial [Prevotellaceae bacterium]|nr:leucine-rich repeat domain-containing protein [Prevotellaceae bacterium]
LWLILSLIRVYLKNVTIPNSVTSIGDHAFYNCDGLTNVTIPNSVTAIGDAPFAASSNLSSAYVKWKDADKIPSLNSSYDFPYSTCDLYVPTGTKTIYEGKDYWKTFKSIIEPSGQTVKISGAKYGTFGSRYAVAIPEGVSAYTATVDGSTVTMTKIQGGVIPGDCGVILYAEPGDYTFAPNAEVDQIEGNQLVAVTDRTYTCTGEDVGKVYYLGLDNESKATFICLNENGTIPVGKAYLKIDEPIEAGAKLDLVFEDTPTGITSYENDNENFKAMPEGKRVYNLQGVRVNEAYKGIVIMNGKKYMNK